MKNTAIPFALGTIALLVAQSPLLAQSTELVQLSTGPSSGQTVESARSFSQNLSDGVIYLGIATLVLWGLFFLASMAEAAKAGATTRVAQKMIFRSSCLLLFAGLSLTQCKVIPGAYDAGYTQITKPVVGNGYSKGTADDRFGHDCQSTCAGQNTPPYYFPCICKYCGRQMNRQF